jgi:ribonuclease P protein component
MLNRKFRASRTEIEEVIKTGVNMFGNFINAKISRKNTEKLGFSIVVPKKVEKTSVGRHRIKRKISSYIEQNIKQVPNDTKKVVVFLVKKVEKSLDYEDIRKNIEKILKNL